MSNKNSIRVAWGKEDDMMRGGNVSCCYMDFPKWKKPNPFETDWVSPIWPLIPKIDKEDYIHEDKKTKEVLEKWYKQIMANKNEINRINPFKLNKENKTWTAQIILPGIKKDKVKVSIEDGVVKVAADTEVYTLGLPANTNKNSLTAKLEDGILSLNIKELEKEVKSIVVE